MTAELASTSGLDGATGSLARRAARGWNEGAAHRALDQTRHPILLGRAPAARTTADPGIGKAIEEGGDIVRDV